MYSFYLNIGSWTTPVVGSGWIEGHPFHDKCNIVKAKDGESFRFITKLSGKLIFHDNEAIKLKSLSATDLTVPLKVVYDSSDIWEGHLQLYGKYNEQSNECELEAEERLTIESKIKNNISIKFPTIGSNITPLEITILSYSFPNFYIYPPNLPTTEYNYFQDDGSTFTFNDTYKIWEKAFTDFAQTYFTTIPNKAVKIFTILQELLSKIDDTIEIYETTSGLNTGFCPYFENWLIDNIDSYISGDKSLLYYWNDDEKIEEISLNDIIEFFKTALNCDWKIENNIFVFRHASEIQSEVGSDPEYDLTDYFNQDWTEWEEDVKIQDKINIEIVKFGNSLYGYNVAPDGELTEPHLHPHATYWGERSIKYSNDFTASKNSNMGIKTNIVEVIGGASGTGIFLTFYNEVLETYQVIDSNKGEIPPLPYFGSAALDYNYFLSPKYCVENHYLQGRPFSKGEINGVETNFTQKRNTELKLKVPFFTPDQLDIENYLVHTNNGDLEIEELNIKLADGIAELKAVK